MKLTVDKLRRSRCFRGVIKSYMQPVSYFTRKHRTTFVSPTANSYDIVPFLPYKEVYTLRNMMS